MAKTKSIPPDNFKYMASLYSGQEIPQGKLKGIAYHMGTPYAIVAQYGDRIVVGIRLEHISTYKGKYKPVSHDQAHIEVNEKKRPRGYYGIIVYNDGRKYVPTGEQVEFKPNKQKQLDLFGKQ